MMKLRDIFNSAALSNEAQARDLCDRLCTAFPDQPRLKTIASVGAYDAEIGGAGVDSKRLTAVMGYLLRSGFLIDPGFEIDMINFRQKRDFLAETTKADLVFVSFILARHVRGTLVYDERMNAYAESRRDYRSIYGVALSDRHNAESWHQRLQSCDARMIATYGGSDEIGTHILCGGPQKDSWQPLIPTPKHPTSQHVKITSDKAQGGYEMETTASLAFLYNHAANDLPMPWLGFAARNDYLKEAAPTLSDEPAWAVRHRSWRARTCTRY